MTAVGSIASRVAAERPEGELEEATGARVGRLPFVLAFVLAVVAAGASIAALALPGTIASPAVTVGNMQGTALVLLLVTLPVLIVSTLRVARGHVAWLIGWLGALASIAYQAVLFLFGTPFNPFFHAYVAMLSLSVWSMVALCASIDVGAVERVVGRRAPRRAVAAYLVINAVLFGLLWIQATVPALLGQMPPAFLAGTGMTTGPVQVIDFAFTLPAMFAGAWLLLRGRRWGRLLTGSLLVALAVETTSIGVDQWMGHAADPASPAASAALTPVFGVLTLLGVVFLALFARPIRRTS